MPVYPCHHPTCIEHVSRRGDVCPAHQGKTRTARQTIQHHYDQHHRDADAKQFYNSARWQRAREAKLAECPFCERCTREWARHVHHIVPLKRCTPQQQTAHDNLMSLCPGCHTIIERELAAEGAK